MGLSMILSAGWCKRVKANKGAPGVGGMTVADLRGWIADNREGLIVSLLDGSYRPQPVRGVEIPKPGDHRMVRSTRAGQPRGPSRRVEHCRKPPRYVERMPGGVRGGNREELPYSIGHSGVLAQLR